MTDICLLLEGTYPYVSGGVSSWVYQLIKEFKEYKFSIVYLGPYRSFSKRMHYELPPNVVDFREYYLFDYNITKEKHKPSKKDFDILAQFLMGMKHSETDLFDELYRVIGNKTSKTIDMHHIAYSKETWELITKMYERQKEPTSFVDFFWTWRFIYLPFFSIMRAPMPQSKVYHAISTGYAGMLGVVCKLLYNRPFLLTEHGIYTRERKIEISRADWIYSEIEEEQKVVEKDDFFREWWIELFAYFSRLIYERADEIITLFEGNTKIQIEEGADPKKIKIIPNAVDVQKVEHMIQQSSQGKENKKQGYKVGFIGRVVPIKDVKTLIMAFRIIKGNLANVEFFIIGPIDEDEEYYNECRTLVETEGLIDCVSFTGKANPFDYYPDLDVIVLTSISEAQPLVIMEAQACAVPAVATDVGSCRELLYGRSADDKLLGQSGIVTPICDPEQTAQAVMSILKDESIKKKMGMIGRERINMYYQMGDLVANYRRLYAVHSEAVCL